MPKRRRRTTRRAAAPVARRTRRRARRNPTTSAPRRSRARRVASRVGHSARGLLSSLAPLSTAKQALVGLAGALLCTFAARRFPGAGNPPVGSNDNWTKRNYLFGALGTLAGAALADMIKKGTGKNVLLGGLTLLAYKIFTNEIAPQSMFLLQNFGADENDMLQGYGYGQDGEMLMGYGQDGYQIGDVYTDALGDDYLLGAGGWQPLDESHRIMSGTDEILMGETLVAPDHLGFGETLVAPGPLGFGQDPYQTVYGGAN